MYEQEHFLTRLDTVSLDERLEMDKGTGDKKMTKDLTWYKDKQRSNFNSGCHTMNGSGTNIITITSTSSLLCSFFLYAGESRSSGKTVRYAQEKEKKMRWQRQLQLPSPTSSLQQSHFLTSCEIYVAFILFPLLVQWCRYSIIYQFGGNSSLPIRPKWLITLITV